MPSAAIVDYGMGNLYSVHRACGLAGFDSRVTASREHLLAADVVVLPGVGAFGHAMATLQDLGLVETIREVASSSRILVGICLGFQLLMRESQEFGRCEGLGLVDGDVVPFVPEKQGDGRRLKIPHTGWNQVRRPAGSGNSWRSASLMGIADGEYFYFVHSFFVRPSDPATVLTTSRYGGTTFASGVWSGNVIGLQFHPERSGPTGQVFYDNLHAMVTGRSSPLDPAGAP
jgi:glutamine amidotransferase